MIIRVSSLKTDRFSQGILLDSKSQVAAELIEKGAHIQRNDPSVSYNVQSNVGYFCEIGRYD
jgi:hypothetical protein